MPIQNRDLGVSEQRRELYTELNAAVVTGASVLLKTIPYACAVQGVAVSALGLSGTPLLDFRVLRWTSAGATVFSLGISNLTLGVAVGVSGPAQGWSGLRAGGNTLLNLQNGDVLALTLSGANSALEKAAVCVVVQRSADIVSSLGLST